MEIALVSAPVWNGDIDRNVRTMVRYLGKLRGQADVVVFGESVLQGFDCLCWDYAADRHTAVTLTDASIQRMRTAPGNPALRFPLDLWSAMGKLCTAARFLSVRTVRS